LRQAASLPDVRHSSQTQALKGFIDSGVEGAWW
jgi:hypothetical protein